MYRYIVHTAHTPLSFAESKLSENMTSHRASKFVGVGWVALLV